jgi:hypothetical protein
MIHARNRVLRKLHVELLLQRLPQSAARDRVAGEQQGAVDVEQRE